MTSLLPPNMADERYVALETIMGERLAALNLEQLLLMLFTNEAAQPAQAWQFGAIDEVWNDATTEERTALLKRVIARRRYRGTRWAARDAISAIGYPTIHFRFRPDVLADGTALADGTFVASPENRFIYWLIMIGEFLSDEEENRIIAAFNSWKQHSVHLDARDACFYYVDAPESLDDLSQYQSKLTVPVPVSAQVGYSDDVVQVMFSRALDGDALPPAAGFTFDGTSAAAVGAVYVAGRVLTINLDQDIASEIVSLDYAGTTPRLTVAHGAEVPDFAGLHVWVGYLTIEASEGWLVVDDDGFLEVQ